MDPDNLIITCTVCQETLADVENARFVIASPVCGHTYHQDCISAWFRKSVANPIQGGIDLAEIDVNDLDGKCPVCNRIFRLNFGIQLFLNTEENDLTAQKKKLETDLELKTGQNIFLQSEIASIKSENITLKAENESLQQKCTSLEKAIYNATNTSKKLMTQRNPNASKVWQNSLKSASGNLSYNSGNAARKRNIAVTKPPPTSGKPSTRKNLAGPISTSTVNASLLSVSKKAKHTVGAERQMAQTPSDGLPNLRGILKKDSAYYSQETPKAGPSTAMYSGPVTRSREQETRTPPNELRKRTRTGTGSIGIGSTSKFGPTGKLKA